MLRLARLSALAVLALATLYACGETLPVAGVDANDANDAASDAAFDVDVDASAHDDDAADAQSDGDAPDGGPGDSGPKCTYEMPYGDAEVVSEIAFEGISSFRFDRDGGAYAARDGGDPDYVDIIELPFPSTASDIPIKLVSTPAFEASPAPLAGGFKIYFETVVDGGHRIASGSRSQSGQTLAAPVFATLPGTSQVFQPWSVAGKEVLYYAFTPGLGGSTRDIGRAELNGTDWVTRVELADVHDETHPVVTDDERVMFFARRIAGTQRDIQYVTRPSTSDPWSNPLPVDGANDPMADDEPTWVSPDQCTLFFTSNRGGKLRVYRIVHQR